MIPLALFLVVQSVSALTAFDCNAPGEVSSYLYEPVDDCSSQDSKDWMEAPWGGSILQFPEYSERQHRVCQLVLQTVTMYCSFSKNPTFLETTEDDFTPTTYRLKEEDCLAAWMYGKFEFQGQEIPLKSPGITKILIGADLIPDGFCSTRRETSKVIRGQMELELKSRSTQSLPSASPSRLLDGATLYFSESGLSSFTLTGDVVLSNQPHIVEGNWKSLYSGPGKIIQSAHHKVDVVVPSKLTAFTVKTSVQLCGLEVHATTGPTIFKSNSTSLAIEKANDHFQGSLTSWIRAAHHKVDVVVPSRLAAFTVKTSVQLCGLEVHATTDPTIFISNSTSLAIEKANGHFQGSLTSWIRAGLAGQEFFNRLALGATSNMILKNQCLLEQMIRTSIVNTARKHPELAALAITGVAGWILYPAGQGVRLKRCIERPVIIREQDTCYIDIPITVGTSSELFYMEALTRAIIPSSYEVSCHDPALPIIKIRAKHYTLSPKLNVLSNLSPLQSRLVQPDQSWGEINSGPYSYEIIFSMTSHVDHMSRRMEVERQLIKLEDGSFHQVQYAVGVLPNVVHHIMESLPFHWITISLGIISLVGLILNLMLWRVMFKLELWRGLDLDLKEP